MMFLNATQPCNKVFQPFSRLPRRSLTCKSPRSHKATSEPKAEKTTTDLSTQTAFMGATGLLTPILLDVQNALAQKGELGIVEGRIASMTHPIMMGFLFGASLYTGWLGFQWRYVDWTAALSSDLIDLDPAACFELFLASFNLHARDICVMDDAFRQIAGICPSRA